MEYFISVVNFVDSILLWIVLLFLAVCVVEFIVFLCNRQGGPFDKDGFFVCIVTNLVVTLGLYVLACLVVGFINCLRDQDWNFWANYLKFVENTLVSTIFGIICIGSFVYYLFGKFGISIGGLILSLLSAVVTTVAAFFAGFVIYVIGSLAIIIIKLIFFVVVGFFQSIFQFVIKYWQMSIIALVCPGALYGACCAFVNYIKSFKNEVIHR